MYETFYKFFDLILDLYINVKSLVSQLAIFYAFNGDIQSLDLSSLTIE